MCCKKMVSFRIPEQEHQDLYVFTVFRMRAFFEGGHERGDILIYFQSLTYFLLSRQKARNTAKPWQPRFCRLEICLLNARITIPSRMCSKSVRRSMSIPLQVCAGRRRRVRSDRKDENITPKSNAGTPLVPPRALNAFPSWINRERKSTREPSR
jgi:hypothetical protein